MGDFRFKPSAQGFWFSLVGVFTFFLDFGFYLLLRLAGSSVLTSSLVAVLGSSIIGFFLHDAITFSRLTRKHDDRSQSFRRAIRYVIVILATLSVQLPALYAINLMGADVLVESLMRVAVLIAMSIARFFLYRYRVFRS